MTIRYIEVTDDMLIAAKNEAKKRDPYIMHHFEVSHLSSEDRDVLGFFGRILCL